MNDIKDNKYFIRVYDNGGKTMDRYTVLIYDGTKSCADVYGMSVNADAPNGFNQSLGSVADVPAVAEVLAGKVNPDIGHEVKILDLPLAVRLAIGKRLN